MRSKRPIIQFDANPFNNFAFANVFNVRTVDQSSGTQGSFSFGDGVSFNWEILECSSSNLKANIDDIIGPLPDYDINRESFMISYYKCGDTSYTRKPLFVDNIDDCIEARKVESPFPLGEMWDFEIQKIENTDLLTK